VNDLQVVGYVATDVGKVRQNNEDSAAFLRQAAARGGEVVSLAIVADGMGGHQGGEVASQIAAELIPASFFRATEEPPAALEKAFQAANHEMQQAVERDPRIKGMGTTAVAVAIQGSCAWCAWVGDSRIYHLRQGRMHQISEDHTAVAELMRQGLLTPEQARNHPDRNVLVRALGTRSGVEVDVTRHPLAMVTGDRMLLCSDGLYDLLEDEEIEKISSEGSLQEAGNALIAAALERGGHDNVSIVLVECVDELPEAAITREVGPA
jgi:protein phosphatase